MLNKIRLCNRVCTYNNEPSNVRKTKKAENEKEKSSIQTPDANFPMSQVAHTAL